MAKKEKEIKTNAMRLLEQKKISFSPQAKAEVQVMTNALREILVK